MMVFGKRSALVEALSSLAGYNDKGYSWSGHSEAQVATYRERAMLEIQRLVANIGRARLPVDLPAALDSGALAVDASGRCIEMARSRE